MKNEQAYWIIGIILVVGLFGYNQGWFKDLGLYSMTDSPMGQCYQLVGEIPSNNYKCELQESKGYINCFKYKEDCENLMNKYNTPETCYPCNAGDFKCSGSYSREICAKIPGYNCVEWKYYSTTSSPQLEICENGEFVVRPKICYKLTEREGVYYCNQGNCEIGTYNTIDLCNQEAGRLLGTDKQTSETKSEISSEKCYHLIWETNPNYKSDIINKEFSVMPLNGFNELPKCTEITGSECEHIYNDISYYRNLADCNTKTESIIKELTTYIPSEQLTSSSKYGIYLLIIGIIGGLGYLIFGKK